MSSLPKKMSLFRGGFVFYCYFCDMYHTLFPDFFTLDGERSEQQALHLAEALQRVELKMLATHAERRLVLRRLEQRGVINAWQLLQLQHEEVAEWPGVGAAFLSVLDEMRDEVYRAPELLVQTWKQKWAELTFPDDIIDELSEQLPIEQIEEKAEEIISTTSAQEIVSVEVAEVERTLTALLRTLLHRLPNGEGVVRRYFLEGLPVSTIVRVEGLASRSAVYRIADRQCLRVLLRGETLHGLRLSEAFLSKMSRLSRQLLFCPNRVLDSLQTMKPTRFLRFLNLTLLCRTTAETQWAADLIVPHQGVQRSRRLLHRTMGYLQLHPDFLPRRELTSQLNAAEALWLKPLLRQHPWVERSAKGYRLRSEQLQFDFCRAARILCDAKTPCSLEEVIYAYEYRYLERPKCLTLSGLRRRFPQVVSEERGVWRWEVSGRKSAELSEGAVGG